MIYKSIERIILFGGSKCCAELSRFLSGYKIYVFSCDRQLNERLYESGATLRDILIEQSIPFTATDDISNEPKLRALINETTLGIGLGEAWGFSKEIIDQFGGRLLDLMGIRLPQYRGGAHYSWQILRKNRLGCCNLQEINEEMIQGVFDSGKIVKSKDYFFPAAARTPEDYFRTAVQEEIEFIKEFLEEVKQGKEFVATPLQETFSLYFPRLNTLKHGFIDWSWDTECLESFICAFDEPYAGASTFLRGRKLHLKQCHTEFNDGPFHPFQTGLIYKIHNSAVFVATRSGTLIIHRVIDTVGNGVTDTLNVGERFYTPIRYLEEVMKCSIQYTSEGVQEKSLSEE